MGKKYFCKPCGREVGAKTVKAWKRILIYIFLSFTSFVGLFIYFLNESNAGKLGLYQTQQDAPSDAWLLIPLIFFGYAIYFLIFGSKKLCPICNTKLTDNSKTGDETFTMKEPQT